MYHSCETEGNGLEGEPVKSTRLFGENTVHPLLVNLEYNGAKWLRLDLENRIVHDL